MTTPIEWCGTYDPVRDQWHPGYTFNPWWGCTKISPGCKFCYAEGVDQRHNLGRSWGPGKPRRLQSTRYWEKPFAWARKAERLGVRLKVFCSSMADVFERHDDPTSNEILSTQRSRLWYVIQRTPQLDWLLLTKRPRHVHAMVPPQWWGRFPRHVWVGFSAEDQERLEERAPWAYAIGAARTFLSYEPALGPIDLRVRDGVVHLDHLDWVIAGAESRGSQRPGRPMDLDWVRTVRDQCGAAGVPFFFKQAYDDGHGDLVTLGQVGRRKVSLPELDGRAWREMPESAA